VAGKAPPERVAEIRRAYLAAGGNVSAAARAARCGKDQVYKYCGDLTGAAPAALPAALPDPAPEAGGPALPEPHLLRPLVPVHLTDPGWWLVLGDCHLPMHDRATIEAAVGEARDRGVVGVLLNGDVMDMFGITPFFRVPTRDRFADEIECGRQFLAWLRSRLPKARLVYRQGNHEFRLVRYVAERAAALFDLPEVHVPALLHLDKFGVEWVADKRKVMLGKLTTLHGHELRKGEGVNPARLAFLRTTATVLVNHYHRTSEHHQRSLDEKFYAAWSVGCACYLHPDYDPYGQSNHGYAMVEVAADGWFSVHNRRVLDGRVV
jgi:predicted phosphodiesterase